EPSCAAGPRTPPHMGQRIGSRQIRRRRSRFARRRAQALRSRADVTPRGESRRRVGNTRRARSFFAPFFALFVFALVWWRAKKRVICARDDDEHPCPGAIGLMRELQRLASCEREVQVEFLIVLAEFDRRNCYLELGFPGNSWMESGRAPFPGLVQQITRLR